MPALPEQQARQNIDALLAAAGWAVQDYKAFDPTALIGVVPREVPLMSGRCGYKVFNPTEDLGREHQLFRDQSPMPLSERNKSLVT